jgi:ribose transport system permease protein
MAVSESRTLEHSRVRERLPARVRIPSFRNASALYVFVVLFVIFSLWIPDTFLTTTTWRTLLDGQALTVIVAVGVVVPLAAGAFDLSIGAVVGIGSMLVAWLLGTKGVPIVPAMVLTLVAGLVIGVLNGVLIVHFRIGSFIATLGVSSALSALVLAISGGEQILGLSTEFQKIATGQLLGITYPVYFALVLAIVIWYVLELTSLGRRIHATGGNADAARLAGVRTGALIIGALVVSAVTAMFAGVLAASRIGTGDPSTGPDYLIPALTAAFLGSTQFRNGRFNVWGTVAAVYVLAVGVKGLQLAGAPFWIPSLFNGVALLVAVGLSSFQAGPRGGVLRGLRRRRSEAS